MLIIKIKQFTVPGGRVTQASGSNPLASVRRRDQASTEEDPFLRLFFVNEKQQIKVTVRKKKEIELILVPDFFPKCVGEIELLSRGVCVSFLISV